jgi:hypothetical protein
MLKHVNFSKEGLLVFVLLLGLTSAMHLNAQATSKATYNKTTKMLALDTKAPFSYLFELDIKPMNFASKEKADAFFSNWTTELVSFQVNYEKRTAEVLLKTRMNPTWGVKEWNDYLAQLPKQ